MKTTNNFGRTIILTAAVITASALSAKADIILDLQDATSKARSGFVASLPQGGTLYANELIGLYRFDTSGLGLPGSGSLWSTCLSPAGNLDWNAHTYVKESFVAGSPGRNPASWAAGANGDSGIQNAQFLWRLYSPTIIASGNADQGAGLVLAMYEALYDSLSYGTVNQSGPGNFNVTQWASPAAQAAYTTYLAGVSSISVPLNLGTGDILRDAVFVNSGGTQYQNGAGQDLIFNVTPVPEPTTVIAGALLLLPFAVSTIRFVRKSRTP